MKKGNTTHWKSKVEASEALNHSRRQFDRLLSLPGNPGRDGKGFPIEAWTAFAAAVKDPNNELKRLRAELLAVQIEKARANLIDRRLFVDHTEKREVALVQLVEMWRQNRLGKMRDPSEAAIVDDCADSFRTTMKDALDQQLSDYNKRCLEQGGGDLESAVETADMEVGAE